MAWRAYLDSVTDNPSPTDSFYGNIRFQDDAQGGIKILKSYKFMAGTSVVDIRAQIRADLNLLNSMVTVKNLVTSLIGTEIT